ncbi:MAG: hypothetical protein ACYCP0_04280 [Acidiferrobacteraceae bacterium]
MATDELADQIRLLAEDARTNRCYCKTPGLQFKAVSISHRTQGAACVEWLDEIPEGHDDPDRIPAWDHGCLMEVMALHVSAREFWYEAYFKDSDLVVRTDQIPIADLPAPRPENRYTPDTHPQFDRFVEFIQGQIEDGNLDLKGMAQRLVRYALTPPAQMIDEFNERIEMRIADVESGRPAKKPRP